MTAAPTLSVVILTRDPGPQLLACLRSVEWADEVIAVDDDSSDGTGESLRRHGATVMRQDRELIAVHAGNFDVARNPAIEAARGDWVLVLDADETVPAELAREIRAAIGAIERVAYEIPRRNHYWGRPSRVLGDDFQLRLFPRGAGRYAGTRLDQPPEVDCPVRRLNASLEHRQHGLLRRLHRRTDQRARVAAAAGTIPAASAASLFWHHLRWYTVRQGAWRDGVRGLALAALYAAYPALEATKARRLRRQEVRG